MPHSIKSIASVERFSPQPMAWGRGEVYWDELFRASPNASPYLSTAWTSAWLDTYGPLLRPEQLVVRGENGKPIGTCLVTVNVNRAAIVPLRRAHINTDGERPADSVVIEHNGVLCAKDHAGMVHDALAAHFWKSGVDEIRVAGATESEVRRWRAAFEEWRPDVEWKVSPIVDLKALRESGQSHMDVLSRNTREQLRRSVRKYRERGELSVEVAESPQQALRFFDEMVALHELRWQSRGKAGGFATRLRRQFHTAFVSGKGAASGIAQMLRVQCADRTIGVLYNLVANGRVYFYQSGLGYEDDGHLKPGLVVHHLAIEHYLSSGYDEYDFLPSGPGEGRYKQSLSNTEHRLGTLLLQRPGWRRDYFDMARGARRVLGGMLGRKPAEVAGSNFDVESDKQSGKRND